MFNHMQNGFAAASNEANTEEYDYSLFIPKEGILFLLTWMIPTLYCNIKRKHINYRHYYEYCPKDQGDNKLSDYDQKGLPLISVYFHVLPLS